MRVAVIYLARRAEGIEPFQRFAESYQRHPAGFEHELVVLYKGFENAADLAAAKTAFAGIPHTAMQLPDTGLDIGSYIAATERIDHEAACYFNTFSEISAPNWLRFLHQHLAQESVGIVGATGSYESLYSSWRLLNHVIWITQGKGLPFSQKLYDHFHYILDFHSPGWCARRPKPQGQSFLNRLIKNYRRQRKLRRMLPQLVGATEPQWQATLQPGQTWAHIADFPVFPNPHIRSNAFMVRRRDILARPHAIHTKDDACRFESGPDGLTATLRQAGLRAVVVDRTGRGFDVPDWVKSRTFRREGQEDLLVRDNQTKQFDEMTEGAKQSHILMTWGEYAGRPMAALDLNLRFARHPEVTR